MTGRPEENRAVPPPGRALRVLIVEDEQDTAESLEILLRYDGFEIEVTSTGSQALAAAQAHAPDVVLLDIGLPRMNGYELARRLREQAGAQVPRLIAITGYGQAADRLRSREAGIDLHLVKPVDPRWLGELLRTFGRTSEESVPDPDPG
jgi:DNA-binding response OmpR family regulator